MNLAEDFIWAAFVILIAILLLNWIGDWGIPAALFIGVLGNTIAGRYE